MTNSKVSLMRVGEGIYVGSRGVSTTIDATKEGFEMELHPAGVLVQTKDGKVIVPYSNVKEIKLAPDEALTPKKGTAKSP